MTFAWATSELVVQAVVALLAVAATVAALQWLHRRRRLSRLRQRAGVAAIRVLPSGRLHLLLIRSRKHREVFTFPAGTIERGESPPKAAAREALEEAGVTGRLGRRLGEVYDEKAHTTLYALHVEEEHTQWQEAHERERHWFDLGAPGCPGSEQAVARARDALTSKPATRGLFDQLQLQFHELAQECERFEQKWARTKGRG
jgi:8-oxo-dGTP pyrophosphatase MutT (NUDIX family)